MAGALRKTMVYLGLAEEDERYEGYDEYDYDEPQQRHEPQQERSAAVTPLPQRTPVAHVVRDVEVGALNRITTIHPRTYNEAKNIGESFRDGTPVIMNLSDMDDSDAKRLVDFAAGLVFGLHGSIERVTSKVFLLSPSHVEVSAEESASAPSARGLFNQS
jgi:cell division inhibitor SepF